MRFLGILIFLGISIVVQGQESNTNMDLDKAILRAIDHHDNEEYSISIQICDSIIAIDSTYDRAYFERAMAYLGLDKNVLAIQDFEKLTEINPKYPGLKDWYSRTLKEGKSYIKAAETKLNELRDSPKGKYDMGVSPWDWAECAENYYNGGQINSAIRVLDEYFETYSKKVNSYKSNETAPYRIYTKILIDKNEIKNAYAKMEQAMKSENKVPADYELWIEVNILSGNHESAQEIIKYYVLEIHDGFETENVKRLKNMMK